MPEASRAARQWSRPAWVGIKEPRERSGNYQLSIINYQLSTINAGGIASGSPVVAPGAGWHKRAARAKRQLSTINFQLSTINYQLSTINYHAPLVRCLRRPECREILSRQAPAPRLRSLRSLPEGRAPLEERHQEDC